MVFICSKYYSYLLGDLIRQTVQSETMGSLPGDVTGFSSLRSWRAAQGRMMTTWRIRSFSARITETKRCQRRKTPVPLIRGSGKDPPFTFAPAVMGSFHICVGSWRDRGRYLCLFWLNPACLSAMFPFVLLGQPIRSTTGQPKHLHLPWPAARLRA